MNTCVMCEADGVLLIQRNWYCRSHMVDGAMEAFRLVSMWLPMVSPEEVLYNIRREILDEWNFPYTLEYPDPDEEEYEDDDEALRVVGEAEAPARFTAAPRQWAWTEEDE